MNLDLFAADKQGDQAVPIVDAPRPKAPPPTHPMERITADLGRWRYRGEIIVQDIRLKGLGVWSTLEGIGQPRVCSDDLAVVHAAIDEQLASQVQHAG